MQTNHDLSLVAQLMVRDLDDFMQRYAIDVVGQLQKVGAEVLAAGTPEHLEGNSNANRAVVIRFPNSEVAKKWYASAEYKPFKNCALRN